MELCAKSATEVVDLLEQGEISPHDLIDASLARMAQVEPAVNAVPTVCEERARAAADRLMDGPGRPDGLDRGWLAGLPVLIKDLVDVGGVRTTYGSTIFADNVPEESTIDVKRLESHGGIVLGKTNTPEFGAGANTFNEVLGTTRNPWDTSLSCAGSSGGHRAGSAW